MSLAQAASPGSGVGDLVNRLAQELAQLQRSLASANRKLASSNRSLEARTQELGEARNCAALLRASLDCAQDGLMAVARFGRTMHCNARFAQIWRIPLETLPELDEPGLIALQVALVQDPAAFLAGIRERRARPDEEHLSRIELADGRVLECYVAPQKVGARRLGTVTAWREVA